MTIGALACVVMAGVSSAARDPVDARYLVDGTDRYRVAFDPGNQLSLAAAVNLSPHRASDALHAHFEASLRFRWSTADASSDSVYWLFDHRYLQTRLSPDGGLSAALFRGHHLSHSDDPFLSLPIVSTRIPFPFNPGFSITALELETERLSAAHSADLSVLTAHLLLDFLRDGELRNWGRFGVGMRYDLLFQRERPGIDHAISTFAPFTSVIFELHHESADGLWLMDGRLEVAPRWSRARGWRWLAAGSVRGERVLLAIEDQPVALFAELSWRRDAAELGALPSLDGLSCALGIRGAWDYSAL